jgi:hypothetical protein
VKLAMNCRKYNSLRLLFSRKTRDGKGMPKYSAEGFSLSGSYC